MIRGVLAACFATAVLLAPALVHAQAPVAYRLSFPEPEHRWMQVEVSLQDLPAAPLELQMSRSSPGRYALHEFAKNIFGVQVTDTAGVALPVTQPNPHQWMVTKHPGAVRVTYRVYGDRLDGTYLAIDSTHAHINMPSALMWARGLEQRPVTVRFENPAGARWRVATQLLPGADPLTFTAPNLQYLMDSPSEFSAFDLRTFSVSDGAGNPTFRVAIHHDGGNEDVEPFVRDMEKIVREARLVYGEYPAFEGKSYTFIADYLPWASGDGMEHRNSTILTSASSIRGNRAGLLDTISHEFFHAWNVERIRPRSLEPFDFADANVSGELWLAEGFTSYYGPLVLLRSGVTSMGDFLDEMAQFINSVTMSPGRRIRTAEDMSRFAPFVDAAAAIDRTSFSNTYLSYYTWGAAIGLGLDLSLRDRSNGKITLDHFMRALWVKHGKPGGKAPGIVDRPYSMADLEAALSSVSGDATFAAEFFSRYIQGHDVVDYRALLKRMGLVLRPRAAGQGFAGDLRMQDAGGQIRVAAPVPFASPAYEAGLERDDVIVAVGGNPMRTVVDVERTIRGHKPGESLAITFQRRGQRVSGMLRLTEDPRQELVAAEAAGQPLTQEQQRLRDAWLSSASRNTF